ncbi:MAG: Hsp70 family protein, partial [Planctomycetales bacterium]|nr:Hsp70 family protein [Planctomycetales bacterium]
LTLPASFDEVARELTVEAAAKAGLPRVVLIEEPQAAFYSWVARHLDDWESRVRPGEKILVCDIGGGTSDFTLIRVRQGQDGNVQFHRVAVGDHLILGGDNLDLALARHLEAKLGKKLEARQWSTLHRVCRQAKETLLAPDAPEQTTVHLPSSGAKLIGGGLKADLTRDEARTLLVEGFFPRVELDVRPDARQSGFQEFGLPYAADPAITKYLAAFLTAHRHAGLDDEQPAAAHDPARPDKVLLAGGPFNSPVLCERIAEQIAHWFSTPEKPWRPEMLDGDRLDVMVARGAAYYGLVRRGLGVKISASLARSYYIGVDGSPPRAVCLAPASTEAGDEVDLSAHRFQLQVATPVEFPLYVSSTRLTDPAGALVEVDAEQMTALPPIRTVLQTRKRREAGVVDVSLHARLTEIGTLDLWCAESDGPRSWRLQFDVRAATQTDVAAHEGAGEQAGFLEESAWTECRRAIEETFGDGGQAKPAELVARLSEALGSGRWDWPPSLLRRIWEALLEVEAGRRKSPQHEARWLNLIGFALRPGFGMAVDDWRVAETRKIAQGKLAHHAPAVAVEARILWRRIAGGLPAGAQVALADPLIKSVRGLHRQLVLQKGQGADLSLRGKESIETWRLLGALELLPLRAKIDLGDMVLDLAAKRKMDAVAPALVWTLGRLGTRVPAYGPMNAVVPAAVVGKWLPRLMELPLDDPVVVLAALQLGRKTGDRHLDSEDALRERVLAWMRARGASNHFLTLVREGGQLDTEEQGSVFGESLPSGLTIR